MSEEFFLFLSIFGEVVLYKNGKLTNRIKCEKVSYLEYFEQKFLFGVGRVREVYMCACHTNHGVRCIKERIKLPVRK